MSASDDRRRVHFQSPAYLLERLDAVADLFETDRTDLLVDAISEYLEETAADDSFQDLVARKYYDDQIDAETVSELLGPETAQRLRLLKADLDREPFDLDAPDDADIYEGETDTVDAENGSEADPDR
ncbi:hypothetical protein D8Y22_16360 [Salinadaptatus halalkaliphilus]|uniref:Uncharacterized protein n=1 Tax=Salinadaptatus halalkaliphilus TaxID=2419781 RepID=A0A4S3TIQ0_9EURY|nr:hypothetical protein [Salinadaptatus halalkaliphilus]THE63944.1 hypothetical protein D8Y22_16360 [Salinadaptatus halalkaliphilus]